MSTYIVDKTFQLIRTNPLLTSNYQIVVDSKYNLYLESINSHKFLSDDKYKHFHMTKYTFLEDKLAEFYKGLPINIAFSVKFDADDDIVYNTYDQQFDTIYWAGASKIKENEFYAEEYEYFAPLYITKNELPSNFVILRVDEPAVYALSENDYIISNTSKFNFRDEIVNKWKCISVFDMTLNSDFGYWLDQNYISNPRFPKAPLEFDIKKYNLTKWYGIDYFTGVYTNKSMYLEDKLRYENPHFRLEQFITEGFKNSELIFPNIANFKFLFNDTPASPFELKPYSINRYYGFYVDLQLVKNITPYRATSIKSGLKIENNIFMSVDQISGSTMPFESWDDNKNYYIYAIDNLYKVIKTYENGEWYYKIISDKIIKIDDITRDNEVDIIFNDLGNKQYNNYIRPRTSISLYIDRLIEETGVRDLYADLYLIKIDDKFHVLESKINQYTGLIEHYIRTDYGIECDYKTLTYWLVHKEHSDYTKTVLVEDVINNELPITFPIYRAKFREIKDFDFNRIESDFANFDCYKPTEYNDTTEHKLYAVEYRDASETTIFKTYDKNSVNSDKIINVSSEYISTDELFEINKNGLTDIWRKNQSICKWGYVNSISHSDYPYKLNNSNKVGSTFNRTTDVFNRQPNVIGKTHDYFYRIGDFYKSKEINNQVSFDIEYYTNQSLSIQTSSLETNYFDLDKYIASDFDYFDYFFKNVRYIDADKNYEQTAHYSIINNGDDYIQSSTLFKGIKYNFYKVSNIIRDDDTGFITKIITSKKTNYNGYKFSIILNDRYSGFTNKLLPDYYNMLPLEKVYSSTNILGNDTGIHIFVNDKYKNILIIVCVNFAASNNEVLTLNNITAFDQREGLYLNKTKSGTTAFINYNNNLLVAYNFIESMNNLNDKNSFERYISFYYINDNAEFGACVINPGVQDNLYPIRNISNWQNDFPPIQIVCETPDIMNTKKQSYKTAALKGPKFNIYDKYKTDYTEVVYDKSFIKEPLSRIIEINEAELKPKPEFTSTPEYENTIYRYSGPYEPIFKNIELFAPIKYNIINDGYFSQSRCGGHLSEVNNMGLYEIAAYNVELEINKLNETLKYINNKAIEIGELLTESYILNDSEVTSNLLNQLTFYDELKNYIENQIVILNNTLISYTGGTFVSSETGSTWIFKDKALGLCDGNFASCEMLLNMGETYKTSNRLEINTFNFNIPLDSTIKGISLSIRKRANLGFPYSAIADNVVSLIKPDGNLSDNYAKIPINDNISDTANIPYYWNIQSSSSTYGGSKDLWGNNWTAQEINNKNFGVAIEINAYKRAIGTMVNIGYIDCICVTVYYTINSIPTGLTYVSSTEVNTIFDTGLYNFGEVSELMYSKVNEVQNILKIKNTEEDRSIYPMVDEFGYSYDKRFIFKSSWDSDYYIRTKNEIE